MASCKFCTKFRDPHFIVGSSDVDTILLETDNFFVTPTLGSLVEGWLLIISKQHFLSVGGMNPALFQELERLIADLKTKFVEVGLNPYVFEHGPAITSSVVGCGIDHLHLHLVPLPFNLYEKAKDSCNFEWKETSSIASSTKHFQENSPYLYIETPQGKKYIASSHLIPSQFFRKVIANEMDIPEFYDWKVNFGSENVLRTIGLFSSSTQLV